MTEELKPQSSARKFWLLPIGVISGVALFVTTLLINSMPLYKGKEPTMFPYFIGVGIFAAIMTVLTYQAMAKEWRGKIFITVLIVMVETAVFALSLLLVISNFVPMNAP